MRRMSPLCLSLALVTLAGRAPAQPAAPPAAAAPVAKNFPLEFDRIEIQRVAQTLSERTHQSVLLDGTVKPALSVTLTGSAKTVEEALDQLTKPLRLTWKKVYVMQSSAPVNGEQIARWVESAKAVTTSGLVVEDPGTHQVTLYMRDLPAAANMEEQIHTAWPFLKPVYPAQRPEGSHREAGETGATADGDAGSVRGFGAAANGHVHDDVPR